MVHSAIPPNPPGSSGMLPPLSALPSIVPPVVRQVEPIVASTERPHTALFFGKIAPTVDDDFMLSLLWLCGPVKSWKRPQDPSDKTPKSFGFCEFESTEGVLRALRLLHNLNVDGQELVLNVDQATKEYLERYVEKKTEREKVKKTETEGTNKEEESESPPVEDSKEENIMGDEESRFSSQNFGIVADEDKEADKDALEKLRNMLEERLKTRPLSSTFTQTHANGSVNLNSEVPTTSRDENSDMDIVESDETDDKNDDETTSENKPSSEHDRPETSLPDRDIKCHEHIVQDLKWEKEREPKRYGRERGRERFRRESERGTNFQDPDYIYQKYLMEWESRERNKEYQWKHEMDREKERERERKRLIMRQEEESDDDCIVKRRYGRKRQWERQWEKDEDLSDRLREEEEIAEAKRREIEEQKQIKDEPSLVSGESIMKDSTDKLKTTESKKLLEARRLIETIPASRDELFSYEINWEVYDKHELGENMRTWISKKIQEYLGDEETRLVSYITSHLNKHVQASQMLDLLQSIFDDDDDEADMFVRKMWRILIYQIKKVETGPGFEAKSPT